YGCRTCADDGAAQVLRLGAFACFVEGVDKVETLQRCSCVAQSGIDSLPNGVSDLPRLRAKIDCQYPEIAPLHPEIAPLPGNDSNEPDATFVINDDPAFV